MVLAVERRLTRDVARRAYGPLFAQAAHIFYAHAHDPIGIQERATADEYEPEVATILPRLITARDVPDARRIVHEELVRWFAPADVGDEEDCGALADELWQAYERHRASQPAAVAAGAWAAGGLDADVGRVLHDALAPEQRPGWAGRILATACARMVAPAAVTRVVDHAEERARWASARAAARRLHELALASEQRGTPRRERALVHLAEVVARIVAAAGGPLDPLDHEAGARLAVRLREMIAAIGDRGFAAEAERALLAIAPTRGAR